jgi:hypothetical protein
MTGAPAAAVDLNVLFIGGVHRSGTSLLHHILRAHSDISGFANTGVSMDEGQHLQSIYPTARAYGGPGRFGFDPRSFMDENHPLATCGNAAALAAEWGRHWDFGKQLLIEKSPPNPGADSLSPSAFSEGAVCAYFSPPCGGCLCNSEMVR